MAIRIVLGVFLVLHGLVHLLYLGHSARRFELQPGMNWPDGSWAFAGLLGNNPTRTLAGICCIVAAAGFVIGGVAILSGQSWLQTPVIASAAFSAGIYVLFWNGRFQQLSNQGAFALLINAAILVALLVFRRPDFDF
ncbi:MAG: hypothetical protein JXA58_03980 [Dehalococcoidia bacterium]|nr:hypothetical protein [Dehalococcoidia bacterium]